MIQDITECDSNCKHDSCDFMARVRPAQQFPPYYRQLSMYIDDNRPNQMIQSGRVCRLMANFNLPRSIYFNYYYYLVFLEPEFNFWLVAGFDMEERKHKAFWRQGLISPEVNVSRKELEIREYLLDIRCIMKDLRKSLVTEFLWNAIHVNTVKWDEALELMSGELSLQEVTFQRLRHVALPYLKHHSSSQIYNRILFTPSLWDGSQELHSK